MKLAGKSSRHLVLILVVSQLIICAIFVQRNRQWISSAVLYSSSRQDFTNAEVVTDMPPSQPATRVDIFDLPLEVMNVWTDETKNSSVCAEEFMKKYDVYCERMTSSRINKSIHDDVGHPSLCPCVPPILLGLFNVSVENQSLAELEAQHWELNPGGHWSPARCIPRQKIAIIVPYHNRERHLILLLNNLHTVLQRQLADYTIFVVEQAEPFEMFNKGMLMNAGFTEVKRRGPFDCYIFHDVDMLVEDDRNMYTCSKSPRHLGAYIRKYKYSLGYGETIGGVAAYTLKHFTLVNGFSNECYGWGGEDDDMAFRLSYKKVAYIRFPLCVARYTMISHGRDNRNPFGPCRTEYSERLKRPPVYDTVGLNSVRYTLLEQKLLPLYTWLYINLPSRQETIVTKTTPRNQLNDTH